MTFSHPLLKAITGSVLGLGFVAAAHAQTTWDMPTPYPASPTVRASRWCR